MKHSFFLFVGLCLFLAWPNSSQAQCDYAMARQDAIYFAKAKGYNGYGSLPILVAADFRRRMNANIREFYTKKVPICSYCRKQSVLDSWGGDLAICNAANYYHNLFMADHNRTMRYLESAIQWMNRN